MIHTPGPMLIHPHYADHEVALIRSLLRGHIPPRSFAGARELVHGDLTAAGAADLAAIDAAETDSSVQGAPEASRYEPYSLPRQGSVAILTIDGPMRRTQAWWERWLGIKRRTTDDLTKATWQAIDDTSVETIAMHIHSGGGDIDGLDAFIEALVAARAAKRLVACIDGIGASAAYWAASQAETVYASPNTLVGAIGVYMTLYDLSKMYEDEGVRAVRIATSKLKGAPVHGEEIDEAIQAMYQAEVDAIGEQFCAGVATGRGVDRATVDAWATGECWTGSQAVERGLVDHVATWRSVLTAIETGKATPAKASTAVQPQAARVPFGETTVAVQPLDEPRPGATHWAQDPATGDPIFFDLTPAGQRAAAPPPPPAPPVAEHPISDDDVVSIVGEAFDRYALERFGVVT